MKKLVGLFAILLLSGVNIASAQETWSGTNSAPVAVDDLVVTDEWKMVETNVILNDTDADWDNLIITWLSNIVNWTWLISWSWKLVKFTPNVDFNWTWSYDYTVSDWSLTDTGRVIVTVKPVNDLPIAIDDVFSMQKNTSKTFNLILNDEDVDWDDLTITSLWTILNWVWTITAAWTWVKITPTTNFQWIISFNYTISDWNWWTDEWNVKITVNNTASDEDENEDEENENEDNDNYGKTNSYWKWNWKAYWRWSGNSYWEKFKTRWNLYKVRYKNTIEHKYWNMISKFTDEKLKIVIWRIDDLVVEINTWDYSSDTKEKYNTMLLAIRELVVENLNDSSNVVDIDALFE